MLYTRLGAAEKHIRVLHLHSAPEPDSDLICHFRHVSLEGPNIRYEALSYTWGTKKHGRPVLLFEESIEITENLYIALQNLRRKDHERIIWVDALCIDQSNLGERTQQVSLMGSIYKKAWNVIIWLGQPWNDCHLAVDYLEQLGRDINLHLNPSQTPHVTTSGLNIDSLQLQAALKQFFDFAWWSRVWTVQEWVLAQNTVFQCGQHYLDGKVVRKSVRHYFHHRQNCCHNSSNESDDDLYSALLIMESMEYIRLLLNRVSFPYIISQFRSREATDLRDKVYGMLGLATGQFENLIEAEYKCSVEEVFESSTLKIIQQTGNLEILSHVSYSGERHLSLPSFVPDWTVPAKDSWYTNWLNWVGHLNLFNACDGEAADFQTIAAGRIAIKGIIVDEIKSSGSVHKTVPPGEFLQEMRDIAGVNGMNDNEKQLYYGSQITREVAYWLTLCGTTECFLDPQKDNRPFFRRIQMPTDFSRFRTWEEWFPSYNTHSLTPEIESVQFPFMLMLSGREKVFGATKRGRFGFFPAQCRKGDVIAVLAGGSVPFVLRPNKSALKSELEEERRYTLVGDSFVYGIMDGEAVAPSNNSGSAWEYLVLI